MATYGLTSTGFVVKPFSVIQAELQAEYKAIHGDELDISDYSTPGQEINNLAKKYADQWEMMAALYASFNPDSASGKSLDGVAAITAIERPEMLSSESLVILYGNEGTSVAAGKLIEQTATALQFALATTTVITRTACSDCTLICKNDPAEGEVYSVTIGVHVYSYTVVGVKTKQEVLHELKLLIDAGAEDLSATEGTDNLRLLADVLNMPFEIAISTATLEFDILGSCGRFVCTVLGANSVPANTLQTIITPVTGLDSVNNIDAGTIGRDYMPDDVFRVYRRTNLQSNAFATEEAIKSKLGEVTNVSFARVVSNRTSATDSEGRPAKSFEAIVQGGTDAAVAQTIWDTMPAGIEPYGNTTVIILDSNTHEQTIKFSRPVKKYVWIQIEIASSGEEAGNASQLVKDAILAWSALAGNSGIGTTILYEKHFTPIYSVSGVYETNFMRIGVSDNSSTPPVSYGTANIDISDRELTEYALARMEVNFV